MNSGKQWQWILGAVVGMVVIITVAFSTLSTTTNQPQTPVQQSSPTEQQGPAVEQQGSSVESPSSTAELSQAQSPTNSVVQDGGFNLSEANNWVNFKLKVQQEDSGNFFASNRFNWSLYQEIKLESGKWYTLSARVRRGMSSTPARICVQFKDAQGTAVGEPFNYYHTFAGNDWEQVTAVNLLTPVGTTGGTIFLMSGDGSTNDFDDISLVPSSTPIPVDTATVPPTAAAQPHDVNISAAVTYTVLAGDTLSKIAYQFNISVAELVQANGITEQTIIHPGEQLIIPTKSN